MTELELSAYRKFDQLMQDEGLNHKVDLFIQDIVGEAETQGKNPDLYYVPMLIELDGDNVDLGDFATVLSTIGSIIAVRSTISQLVGLIQLNGVKCLEASRRGGSFAN